MKKIFICLIVALMVSPLVEAEETAISAENAAAESPVQGDGVEKKTVYASMPFDEAKQTIGSEITETLMQATEEKKKENRALLHQKVLNLHDTLVHLYDNELELKNDRLKAEQSPDKLWLVTDSTIFENLPSESLEGLHPAVALFAIKVIEVSKMSKAVAELEETINSIAKDYESPEVLRNVLENNKSIEKQTREIVQIKRSLEKNKPQGFSKQQNDYLDNLLSRYKRIIGTYFE